MRPVEWVKMTQATRFSLWCKRIVADSNGSPNLTTLKWKVAQVYRFLSPTYGFFLSVIFIQGIFYVLLGLVVLGSMQGLQPNPFDSHVPCGVFPYSQTLLEQINMFQIFIRNFNGKYFTLWYVADKWGIPISFQCLQYEGKILHDSLVLTDYNINKYLTIIMNTRSCGDAPGARTPRSCGGALGRGTNWIWICWTKPKYYRSLYCDQMEHATDLVVSTANIYTLFFYPLK